MNYGNVSVQKAFRNIIIIIIIIIIKTFTHTRTHTHNFISPQMS